MFEDKKDLSTDSDREATLNHFLSKNFGRNTVEIIIFGSFLT